MKVAAVGAVTAVAPKPAAAVEAVKVTKHAPATKVLGESFTRAPKVSRAVAPTALPFTGVPVGGLVLIALIALTAGVALTFGFPRAGVAARRATIAKV